MQETTRALAPEGRHPKLTQPFLKHAVSKSPTDSALAVVAACPLEEFLEKYQAPGPDRLERAAETDRRLQRVERVL